MDVSKAFASVWHGALLHILIKSIIPERFIRFIHSFLSDRTTKFTINGITSELIKIIFGTPQGSVLSAILYNLYVSYIPRPKQLLKSRDPIPPKADPCKRAAILSQFADDIKAYNASKSLVKLHNNLQLTLNNIDQFCRKRWTKVNTTKTMELLFTQVKSLMNLKSSAPPLRLQNTDVTIVTTAKFLGIYFDKNLNFQYHVNYIAGRVAPRIQKLHSIYSPRYGPYIQTMIRLYKMFVRSLFEYGNTTTIMIKSTIIQKWEVIQIRFLKRIIQLPAYSNNQILVISNLPSIQECIAIVALKWYNKSYECNNKDVTEFIATVANNCKGFDKDDTPLTRIRATERNRPT